MPYIDKNNGVGEKGAYVKMCVSHLWAQCFCPQFLVPKRCSCSKLAPSICFCLTIYSPLEMQSLLLNADGYLLPIVLADRKYSSQLLWHCHFLPVALSVQLNGTHIWTPVPHLLCYLLDTIQSAWKFLASLSDHLGLVPNVISFSMLVLRRKEVFPSILAILISVFP